jgi:DNA primase
MQKGFLLVNFGALMISRDTIDKIYQTAIIEEVIGDFVVLKKSGSSYKGLSPFANEKTPSFYVVPSKGIYKDFSSGKGGNVVDFLMQHERLSYPEALRWLASKYKIDIEEDRATDEQNQERSERESLSLVSDYAHKWFQQQLHETEAGQAIGLSYFYERGFSSDIIRKFQLGYSPETWDALSKAAIEAGYNPQHLLKIGVSRERERNGRKELWDFFHGRVMFPIHNISGKIIAFAGRTLKAEKEVAKYFNSPESELYNKSNVLFGLHLAKNTIVKNDVCYLVEGYTDVISLHQSGIENVVASSGTSLTEGQIKLIRRYTPNVTILYDGDAAGIKASFRGIDMLLKEGINVRVVLFPDGDDPDSFARKNSATGIQNFIAEQAKDFIAFKTSQLLADAGGDPIKRASLIRSIVQSIALIPDAIKRSVYVQECSQLLRIGEAVLTQELNKVILGNVKKEDKQELPILDETPADGHPDIEKTPELTLYHQERDLIRLLLTFGEKHISISIENEEGKTEEHEIMVAEFLIGSLEQDEISLTIPAYQRILTEYTEIIAKEEIPEIRRFSFHPDTEVSSHTSDLVSTNYELSHNWTARHSIHPEQEENNLLKASKDAIYRLKLRKVMAMIQELQKELELLVQEQATDEEVEGIQKQMMDLLKARKELSKYFGTVILQ